MSYTNPFIHEFYIDLTSGATKQREKKSLSQGDAYADKILVNVQDNGKPVYLDGMGVSAKVIRFDGKTVPLTGSVEGGAACIVLDDACYDVPGDIKVSIVLSAGEIVQTILVLTMNVDTSETSIIVDNGVIGDLTEILAAIADMRAATEDAHAAADDARNAVETIVKDVDSAIADMSAKVNEAAPSIIQESSGGLVSISDAANRNAQVFVSEIKPSVDGVSAVTLTRTGRNLVSNLDYIVQNGHSNTSITADVIDVKSPTKFDYGRIPITFKAGVTYTLVIDWEVYGRADAESGNTRASYYAGKSGTAATNVYIAGNGSKRIARQYTFAEDTVGRISWCPNQDGDVAARSRSRIMLLDGAYTADTAPEFVPCDKQTLTASLPETVYGGTLDWTTGLLTITHGADGAEMAEHRTIQLDPQTLEMLKGHNAVWSDTGDTSLVYVADTKLYIDNAVAAIAAAIINN